MVWPIPGRCLADARPMPSRGSAAALSRHNPNFYSCLAFGASFFGLSKRVLDPQFLLVFGVFSGTNFWSNFGHDFCLSGARGEGSGSNFGVKLTRILLLTGKARRFGDHFWSKSDPIRPRTLPSWKANFKRFARDVFKIIPHLASYF